MSKTAYVYLGSPTYLGSHGQVKSGSVIYLDPQQAANVAGNRQFRLAKPDEEQAALKQQELAEAKGQDALTKKTIFEDTKSQVAETYPNLASLKEAAKNKKIKVTSKDTEDTLIEKITNHIIGGDDKKEGDDEKEGDDK